MMPRLFSGRKAAAQHLEKPVKWGGELGIREHHKNRMPLKFGVVTQMQWRQRSRKPSYVRWKQARYGTRANLVKTGDLRNSVMAGVKVSGYRKGQIVRIEGTWKTAFRMARHNRGYAGVTIGQMKHEIAQFNKKDSELVAKSISKMIAAMWGTITKSKTKRTIRT